jgi:tetratricopeptide (TPR) repeat protein
VFPGTKAEVISIADRWLTINKGSTHGVTVGMEGVVITVMVENGKAYDINVGVFAVKNVNPKTSMAYITKMAVGMNPLQSKYVVFNQELKPPIMDGEVVPKAKPVDWYLDKGDEFFKKGKYSEAVKYYKKILEMLPDDPFAKEKIRECQEKIDELQDMQKNSARISYLHKVADRLMKENRYKDAQAYYSRVLQINPSDALAKKSVKKISEILDYQSIEVIDLENVLRFEKKWPGSSFTARLKEELQSRDSRLPPSEYWQRIIKNSKGYYEIEFANNHIMVWIPPLKIWVDKYEVSRRQYFNFLDPSGAVSDPEYPIADISLDMAAAYCRHYGFRLLSKEEWEVAAGSGSGIYPWGSEAPGADGQYRANFEPLEDGYKEAAPVKSFLKYSSPYGIVNLSGNVWEWVSEGAAKGGSFLSFADALEIKHNSRPQTNKLVGFRCAKDEPHGMGDL